MTRWFRHYGGMMRDEKLVRVAAKSGQSVERVIWIWGALLESASEVNDGGRYDFDSDEAAYFLRCTAVDVDRVLDGLAGSDRIRDGVVTKWRDRQYDSDSSRERQRRYREKTRANGGKSPVDCNGDGDTPSRDGEVTVQEDREQITDTSSLRSDVAREPKKRTPRDELETVVDSDRAQAVIDHRQRIRKPLTTRAAKLLAGKFASWGDANAAADAMIVNGWQSFEVEWMENRHGRGPPQRGVSGQTNGGNGHAPKRTTASIGRELADEFRRREAEAERGDGPYFPALIELSRTG